MYCNRIDSNIDRMNGSFEVFNSDTLFQDACCMCVVQIGELSAQLSESVRSQYSHIPWRIIKDTRNYYVHAYGSIDLPAVWDTLINDIPVVKQSCEEILNNA